MIGGKIFGLVLISILSLLNFFLAIRSLIKRKAFIFGSGFWDKKDKEYMLPQDLLEKGKRNSVRNFSRKEEPFRYWFLTIFYFIFSIGFGYLFFYYL